MVGKKEEAAVPLRWLTPEQAGEYIKLSPRTLERQRTQGKGPRFHFVGDRKVVYDIAELDAFVREGGAR